jgi:hypothetical protein
MPGTTASWLASPGQQAAHGASCKPIGRTLLPHLGALGSQVSLFLRLTKERRPGCAWPLDPVVMDHSSPKLCLAAVLS